jgi:Mg2+-importing ATPase
MRQLQRVPVFRQGVRLLRQADPELARRPRLLARAVGWQIAIVILDAGTIWVLLRAVGAQAHPLVVFTSYMFSSLLRTVGIVPGGLGVFEAASVFMLREAGLPIATALAATLLFRGLSFWLPMLPGLVFAQRLAGRPKHRTTTGRLT